MKNLLIGIDPGLSGAIAIYDLSQMRPSHVFDMPVRTCKVGAKKKELDLEELALLLDAFRPTVFLAAVEKVDARPGQGVTSMFRFGSFYGAVLGILSAYQVRTILIVPGAWKGGLGLSSDKARSLARAKDLWPEMKPFLTLKKHDGRAEAMLIAHFAALHLRKGPDAPL